MVVVEESTDAFTTLNVGGVGHRSSEEAYFRASELLAEDAILFAQIIDQVFLLAVQGSATQPWSIKTRNCRA